MHYNICAFARLGVAVSGHPQALDSIRSRRKATPQGWAREVNGLVRGQLRWGAGQKAASPIPDVLSTAHSPGLTGDVAVLCFSDSAAEAVVNNGLKAPVLSELAAAAGLDVRHLYEFAGIDRTTVARRAARNDVLPHEASVKAMQFAELVSVAIDVFGALPEAAAWLTRLHPALQGQTPLQRARTPWGLRRVHAVLGALKYGGAA